MKMQWMLLVPLLLGLGQAGVTQENNKDKRWVDLKEEIVIHATPEAVWDVVGDFSNLSSWVPDIKYSRLLTPHGDEREYKNQVGIKRHLTTISGDIIIERLTAYSQAGREGGSYIYVVESGPLPVEYYRGNVWVVSKGGATKLIWESRFKVLDSLTAEGIESLKDVLSGIYRRGLERAKTITEKPKKVLFILTSFGSKDRPVVTKEGQTILTGYWGEELVVPAEILESKGVILDFASPGGAAALDPASAPDPDMLPPDHFLFQWTTPDLARRVSVFHQSRVLRTKFLSDVEGDDYDAVVVVGGHGAIFDLNTDSWVHRILRKAMKTGKVVAAECHGVGALTFTRVEDGTSVVLGKKVTGFPDAWDKRYVPGLVPYFPYFLQQRLKHVGAIYQSGLVEDQPPQPFVVEVGNILTSRDPMSSKLFAETLLKKLGL